MVRRPPITQYVPRWSCVIESAGGSCWMTSAKSRSSVGRSPPIGSVSTWPCPSDHCSRASTALQRHRQTFGALHAALSDRRRFQRVPQRVQVNISVTQHGWRRDESATRPGCGKDMLGAPASAAHFTQRDKDSRSCLMRVANATSHIHWPRRQSAALERPYTFTSLPQSKRLRGRAVRARCNCEFA